MWRSRWQLPFFVDPGCVEVVADRGGESQSAQSGVPTEERKSASGCSALARRGSDEVEVEAEPEEGAFADRDVAVLGAFAAADEDGAAIEVDVSDCEVDQFGAAKRAGVEDLEYCAVAQAEGPGEIGRG